MYKLFVFLRSDLESMTPGKAAAQVAHAASQAAFFLRENPEFNKWEYSAADHMAADGGFAPDCYKGFGTTIVLDAGSLSELPESLWFDVTAKGRVTDPSYPLKDGKKTHLLDIDTCWWIFDDPDLNFQLERYLKGFKLYNGNHD